MKKILFLAANTIRSQAYAQAMLNSNIFPHTTIIFGAKSKNKLGQSNTFLSIDLKKKLNDLFFPDFSVSLTETCEKLSQNLINIEEDTVNCSRIISLIKGSTSDFIIYSGFGGEIVKFEVLEAGGPFLHIHSGWLPDFRGSTTLYYSLIKEGRCGVTSFLLDKEIDTGKIIERAYYPKPSKNLNLDYIYDSIIRADLLIKSIKKIEKYGLEKSIETQNSALGRSYYVIHPLLKHIASLSI